MERRPDFSFLISLLVFHLDFFRVGFVVPADGSHRAFSLGDCLLSLLLPSLDLADAVAAVCHAPREGAAATAALPLDAPAAEHEEECNDQDDTDAKHDLRGHIVQVKVLVLKKFGAFLGLLNTILDIFLNLRVADAPAVVVGVASSTVCEFSEHVCC